MDIPIVGMVLIFILVAVGFFAVKELCFYERKCAAQEKKERKERDERTLYNDVAILNHQMKDLMKYLNITHYEVDCGYKKKGG